MEYTSNRYIDGKVRRVIVDESGKIVNRNPNKDELKGLDEEPRYPQDTRKKSTKYCDRCGKEFNKTCGNPCREYNKDIKWTGKWLCGLCYGIDHNQWNILKQIGNRRTGNLDPNCAVAKGDRFQELTCRWRSTISTIPVEDLNKKNDNYSRGTPIDHTPDSELGIIQTRGRLYDSYNQIWGTGGLDRDWYKKFDTMIFYCASKDGKTIERIYIFPKDVITKRTGITLYNNDRYHWYEQYRVTDEETIKIVNEIWSAIINSKIKGN